MQGEVLGCWLLGASLTKKRKTNLDPFERHFLSSPSVSRVCFLYRHVLARISWALGAVLSLGHFFIGAGRTN